MEQFKLLIEPLVLLVPARAIARVTVVPVYFYSAVFPFRKLAPLERPADLLLNIRLVFLEKLEVGLRLVPREDQLDANPLVARVGNCAEVEVGPTDRKGHP